MAKEMILILGGARSGKSALAERLALQSENASCSWRPPKPLDSDMERRIAAHRTQRPSHWKNSGRAHSPRLGDCINHP